MLHVNRRLTAVTTPPVAVAKQWIAGRSFPAHLPLLDVSQAVPGQPPADELREYIARAARADATSRYASGLGLELARDALAGWLAPRGITPNDVMVTSGCNQAFCLAIGALCEPDDSVVIPTPYYFNHDMWLRASGVLPRYVETAPTMVPTVESVAAAVDSSTRAIVLVTPNNPCGVVYEPSLIRAVYELARDRGIALILDETYRNFRATTAAAHDLFDDNAWPETLVQLMSYSKVFSLAGYRVGSLVAAPNVLREALKLADCQTIGAAHISQLAVAYAVGHLDAWVEERRVEMLERVNAFRAHVGRVDGYEIVSHGAFFGYLRHRFAGARAETVGRHLADHHNVLTIPGPCFGDGQEQYLRCAFGNIATDDIEPLAQRLAASLDTFTTAST